MGPSPHNSKLADHARSVLAGWGRVVKSSFLTGPFLIPFRGGVGHIAHPLVERELGS